MDEAATLVGEAYELSQIIKQFQHVDGRPGLLADLADQIRAYGEQCRRAGAEAMREAAIEAIMDAQAGSVWAPAVAYPAVKALRALPLPPAAEAASPAAGWQPIETAPKDGTRVLVDNGNGQFIARWSDNGDSDRFDWRGDDWGSLYSGLTHWMPLPSPPTTERARGG